MLFKELEIGSEFICPDDAEHPRMMKTETCDKSASPQANYCNAVGMESPVKGQLCWINPDDEVEKVE